MKLSATILLSESKPNNSPDVYFPPSLLQKGSHEKTFPGEHS